MDCYLILSITCWIALMLLCYRLNKNNSEKYVTGIILLLLLGLLYWISYSNVCIIGFFIIILPSFMAYIIKIIVNDDIKLCCISFFLFGFSLLAILSTPNSLGDIIATIKCPRVCQEFCVNHFSACRIIVFHEFRHTLIHQQLVANERPVWYPAP